MNEDCTLHQTLRKNAQWASKIERDKELIFICFYNGNAFEKKEFYVYIYCL